MQKLIRNLILGMTLAVGASTPCVAHNANDIIGLNDGAPISYEEFHLLMQESATGRQLQTFCKAKAQVGGGAMIDRDEVATAELLADIQKVKHQMPTYAFIDIERMIRDATRTNKKGNWVHQESPEDFAHDEYDNCIFGGF